VYQFAGVDGLKTGFHAQAGFNVTATAQRDGLRMIAVVMGAPNSAVRFDEAKRLLAMGFNGYRKVVVVRKDTPVGPEIQVSGSTVRKVRAVTQDDVTVIVKKGSEKQLVTDVQVPKDLSAPAHRGQIIGEVLVKHQDQVLTKSAAVCLRRSRESTSFGGFLGVSAKRERARADASMVCSGSHRSSPPPGLLCRPQRTRHSR
jgi:D-alanyl-D-alanine carboxypeptidase (penicillin-binding protein 5/6)